MSLLTRILGVIRRPRLWLSFLRVLPLAGVALFFSRSRAIARQAKEPLLPPIATIYATSRKTPVGDFWGEMDTAVSVEKDEVITITLQQIVPSSHQPRLVIHSPRRPSLNLDAPLQGRESHAAFESSVIETVDSTSTSLEASADRDVPRPPSRRELSPPGFYEDVPELRSRNPLYSPEWALETSSDFWTRLLFEVGIALRFQVLVDKMASGSQPAVGTSNKPQDAAKPLTETTPEVKIPSMLHETGPRPDVQPPPDNDKKRQSQPVWIGYEPRFAPWVPPLEKGDQLLATRTFVKWGIQQWEIGEVTDVEPLSGLVYVGFHRDGNQYFQEADTSDNRIDDNEREPYYSRSFVFLDRSLKRELPLFGMREEAQTKLLARELPHPWKANSNNLWSE